ncbi:MAG: aldehyde:ferredoxin oxidoreductase [Candidatus Mcinerneyibacterium aminivorans]|uniref:Aldehyde:ferredoxin oxidoreductase n=1 Tax=Candidatus Mcinerneyibacterium aminivorans TaxID=2703815 RepID=A0A5D0MIP5_9BACT|nr:MAG: aldehyde:ferredoxin oxidoreductase [Candidatus Mcinerneyibacterium aminivorans]
MKKKHKLLASWSYEKKPVEKGYNNRTLYVNLSDNEIKEKPVSEEMKEKFTGGKGFDLKLLWDAVDENTGWDDPENEINIAAGPIGGITQYPGTGKAIVTTVSPTTGIPIDSNVGGYFGPYLKFSGFDALEVQGKAEKDVIVCIDGDEGKVEIFEAPEEEINSHILAEQLIEEFADSDDPYDKKAVATVSAGKGSENAWIGCLNFGLYDIPRRGVRLKQAGRGGTGTVFRDKKIKALVCKYSDLSGMDNNPADPEKVRKVGQKMQKEVIEQDPKQKRMRRVGTTHIVPIMNEYDLLPTRNFKYGQIEGVENCGEEAYEKMFDQEHPDGCWFGCTIACAHTIEEFELKTGPYKGEKVRVDGPEYETIAGVGPNCGITDGEIIAEMNFYCDTYGLDTISFGTLTAFVMDCWENGILDEEKTGGLKFEWGNWKASLEMMHQMAKGEGFGTIAGKGILYMKEYFAENYGADREFLDNIGMECKGLEYSQYMSKESIAQQGGYNFAIKGPQHDEAWLIFMDQVQNRIPTYEDKAEALYYFPLWRTWFSLHGLCKLPWNDVEPADNDETDDPAKVEEHVENYREIFNAITGKNIDKKEQMLQIERVYNFQRLLSLKLGKGQRKDDYGCPRSITPVTVEEYKSREERYDKQLKEEYDIDPSGMSVEEKLEVTIEKRMEKYNRLMDETYARKGWTNDGVPKVETLKKIGLDIPEIIEFAKKHQ